MELHVNEKFKILGKLLVNLDYFCGVEPPAIYADHPRRFKHRMRKFGMLSLQKGLKIYTFRLEFIPVSRISYLLEIIFTQTFFFINKDF